MTRAVKSGRARRSEGQWRSLLARHQGSGVGIKAFCRRERISEASFYRWRTILGGERKDGEGVARSMAAAFVDLGTLEAEAAAKPTLDLRLDLGDGLVLHLVRR